MIFVNLPVSDLERSKAFYSALGYDINPQFTDENAACIVISENIFAMLLVKPFFANFTSKEIADTSTTVAAINSLSADSREEVDVLADRAIAAGGTQTNEPQDLGFMYNRSFSDPDGNMWETLWMDPQHVQ
jgi:predicted lactoylglutathione lyase